jgi:hypothetical protein
VLTVDERLMGRSMRNLSKGWHVRVEFDLLPTAARWQVSEGMSIRSEAFEDERNAVGVPESSDETAINNAVVAALEETAVAAGARDAIASNDGRTRDGGEERSRPVGTA